MREPPARPDVLDGDLRVDGGRSGFEAGGGQRLVAAQAFGSPNRFMEIDFRKASP